jgi:hypothetical protein
MPSGFTTVNSPTCTAFPMPSGHETAPLDASAAGSFTPVVMPSVDATRLLSGFSPLHPALYSGSGSTGCGSDAPSGSNPFPIVTAGADRLTPYAQLETLRCGSALRAGYT